MVNDVLADAMTRIRNGYRADLVEVSLPNTKKVAATLSVLTKYKYINGVKKDGNLLIVELRYENKQPAIMGIRSVSKPGQKVYAPYKAIPKVWGGLGINVVSTSKGIVSEKEARKAKQGGELLVQVW